MTGTETTAILLVEDDEGHATLVQRKLRRTGIVNEVIWARDGQGALDHVHCQGAYAGRERIAPLVILLDINMPRMGEIETLRQIKMDERTKTIPIVMLTTTDDPCEVEHCYELGCGASITKTVEYDAFCEVVRRLGLFLQIVAVPNERQPAA